MRGFNSWSGRRRRTVAGAGAAIAVIAGFTAYNVASGDEGRPPRVDFVLGGGDDIYAKDDKQAIRGSYAGLAAAPDGTVTLFAQENDGMVMWQRRPSGAVKRTGITGMDSVTAEQAAVSPDGSVYLAAKDLWKVTPTGKAAKVVKGGCEKLDARTAASTFCTGRITGVAVAEDGSVYFGDQVVWGDVASYVHKVEGDRVELVAGRPPRDDEPYSRSNPAVQNGIDPAPGTKAGDVLVTDVFNSGWLALGKDGLYWRTGEGIVRIKDDGTLSPLVAASAPGRIAEAKGPFESVGRARDAEIPRPSSTGRVGDLTLLSGRDEVYYTDAHGAYKPSLDSAYRWQGASSATQKKLLEESSRGKLVHRVADGELSSVIAGVQAIAGSDDALYAAVEGRPDDAGKDPEDLSTAVVRVELPD
ncbi:hypothetical protein AB0Q95_37755 [Streptomyces sp. NPDC059900]|uniref:hypothetical protein n=1 Tax=Streptomyces sp. NPDC059900 TaxID=3155816 RepID=UPI00342BEE40